MLVLSRKADQTIMIGSDVVVTVISVRNNRVKIGIQAPKDVRVLRQELVSDDFKSWSPLRHRGDDDSSSTLSTTSRTTVSVR